MSVNKKLVRARKKAYEKRMKRKQRRAFRAEQLAEAQRQAATSATTHEKKKPPSFEHFTPISDSGCVRANLRAVKRGSWITQGGLCDGNGRSETQG
jgi:hypothetical protein